MVESSIVGREREVGQLENAVGEAARGFGSLWFITGEAGIGKSRLAEEAAQLARQHEMRTFWGRCWEAGGAPAYWPWLQVLRAILRTTEPGPLESLVPTAQAGATGAPERFVGRRGDRARSRSSALRVDGRDRTPALRNRTSGTDPRHPRRSARRGSVHGVAARLPRRNDPQPADLADRHIPRSGAHDLADRPATLANRPTRSTPAP